MMRRLIVLIALVAAALSGWWWLGKNQSSSGRSITVYCAAGLKKPVEDIATQYLKELGVEVRLQYGPTGTLLNQIQVAKQGDLLIAADEGSLNDARKRDVIREVIPLVSQHPVIAVAKGNPKGVHAIADLLKPDVRLALPNPDAASIGRVTREVLKETWKQLATKAAVMKPSVTEVAADLSLGAVDAAIIWDATVPQFKGIEAVEVAELTTRKENASAAVLSFCKQTVEALKFARYMAASDKGGAVFTKHGFKAISGDKWAVKPELILYSGGVNRLAIEKLIQQFADREGATISTVFNGCGILCASMKTMGDSSNPKFPDAYYACDVCFVPPVAQYFPEAVILTETDIVIAVPKGNPKNVKTLADLAQPGLRVGLSNAEQATLGYMTRAMLKSMNLYDSVMKNVVVQVPTSDFLINQMRAGGLDAAIVYRVNVQPQREHLEAITLPVDKAKAVQPFAVRGDSVNRQLSQRLLAYLKGHKESFEAAGFAWRGDEVAIKSDKIEVPQWLKSK